MMVYALIVFNDVDPKYRSPQQTKATLNTYLELLSNHPEQVNETAIINSNEGGRFRYIQGQLTLDEAQAPKDRLKSILFLDSPSFKEALELAKQIRLSEGSIVELRPAIMINRTTEALNADSDTP
jgi:hypothetical protein